MPIIMALGLFRRKQVVVQEEPAVALSDLVKEPEIVITETDREQLKKARMLVVGCGAFGASVALNLASAGVGTLGLADNGFIEEKDVKRQPAFRKNDIGRRKSVITGDRIRELSPDTNVVPSTARMRYDTAQNMSRNFSIIIDCSDNEATHFLVGDLCGLNSKKHVFAHLSGNRAKITFFDAAAGPCFRCLYRGPGIECREFDDSLIGPATAATVSQVVKIILGKEAPGKSLTVTEGSAEEHAIYKNESCELCGAAPSIRHLVDYEQWLGVRPVVESAAVVLDKKDENKVEKKNNIQEVIHASTEVKNEETATPAFFGRPSESESDYAPFSQKPPQEDNLEVSVEETKDRMMNDEVLLIDVREKWEHDLAKLEGSNLIPLGELSENLARIPKDKFVVIYCHTGNRSLYAARMMRENGFSRAYSMAGGIDLWSRKIDSSVPRY